MVLGLLLILPSAYIQFGSGFDAWWLEGLSLVAGATGLALFWTGLTGASPDWVDQESGPEDRSDPEVERRRR